MVSYMNIKSNLEMAFGPGGSKKLLAESNNGLYLHKFIRSIEHLNPGGDVPGLVVSYLVIMQDQINILNDELVKFHSLNVSPSIVPK